MPKTTEIQIPTSCYSDTHLLPFRYSPLCFPPLLGAAGDYLEWRLGAGGSLEMGRAKNVKYPGDLMALPEVWEISSLVGQENATRELVTGS